MFIYITYIYFLCINIIPVVAKRRILYSFQLFSPFCKTAILFVYVTGELLKERNVMKKAIVY